MLSIKDKLEYDYANNSLDSAILCRIPWVLVKVLCYITTTLR